jgi:hypothetical protein
MFYFAVILIVIISAWIIYLLSQNSSDYLSLYRESEILEARELPSSKLELLEAELLESLPELNNFIGKGIVTKLVIPSFVILLLSIIFLGPILTNASLGLILGLIISLAYSLRLLYHLSSNFRSKLLNQIERVLVSIRNNLSTGMTLDYAVANTLKFNQDYPLGPNLARFIKLSETNFIENFPLWLKGLERTFRLKELGRASQLLKLELAYTTNQEEAFVNAAEQVASRIKVNDKQKNTILMTFFTMDFMVLAFLAILFLIIPNISYDPALSWWQSESRPLVVFISALVVWSAYLVTVALTLWRQG